MRKDLEKIGININNPFLSFYTLVGIGLQLFNYSVSFHVKNEVVIQILNAMFLYIPIIGVVGIIIGIIQIVKIKNRILPILGIILNSIWLVVFIRLLYFLQFEFVPR